MRRNRPFSSRGASTTVCRPTELSRRTVSTRDRHLLLWIDCWTKPAVVLSTFANRLLADVVVEAIQYNADILGHYLLHAFVVMPNHVHLLATPAVALPKLTKSLKGITAKRANAMLALTGSPFWQEESYDHLVRHEREFEKIRHYIEENPVRAGLVREAREDRWSSAGWATGGKESCGAGAFARGRPGGGRADEGSAADQGVRPTSGSSGV